MTTPAGFEQFINEVKTHYRLIPLLEIIEEDPPEWERLKLYFTEKGTNQMISDLYDLLEILDDPVRDAYEIPCPVPNPNHKQLSLL